MYNCTSHFERKESTEAYKTWRVSRLPHDKCVELFSVRLREGQKVYMFGN